MNITYYITKFNPMNCRIFSIVTIFIFLQTAAYSQIAEKYNRIEISWDVKSANILAELGIDLTDGVKLPGNKFMLELSDYEISRIKSAGIAFNITINDVSEYYRTRKSSGAPNGRDATKCFPDAAFEAPVNFKTGSMIGYYTYQEFLDVLAEMRLKYPNLISEYKPIGNYKTQKGNSLYWLRISDNPDVNEDEPEVLYTALHHAREPMSLTQLIYFMWYILEHYDTDAEIKALIDDTELYFIPMINPDGYRYNEFTDPKGGGMWRKNLKPNVNGGIGIDLNRNYGKFWGYDNIGSSPSSVSSVYRGPSPFSEVETQAVRDFCLAHDFKYALNAHAFGNLLLYPWGHDGSNCEDSTTFQRLADRMVDLNKYTAGTSIETVGYYANGSSDDWMYGGDEKTGKTIALTAEVGEFYDGFWPFEDRILPLAQSCLEMNLQLLKAAHNNVAVFYKEIPAMSGKDERFVLDAIQTGIAPLPVTMHVSEPTGKMIFTKADTTLYLPTNAIEKIAFDISWGAVQNGDQVTVYFDWTDGIVSHYDSVVIGFYDVKESLFKDDFSNLDNWTNSLNWGITSKDFYKGGSCVTDSPDGAYATDIASYLALKQPLLTSGQYDKIYLKYHAKWSLQPNFDYAAVAVEDYTTGSSEYLCSFNMTKGTLEQAAENSVYEGNALKWEQEVIDISHYNNTSFGLLFELGADDSDERDGFYLDELEIVAFRQKTTSATETQAGSFRIQPNPASDEFMVKAGSDFDEIEILNLSGIRVFHQLKATAGDMTDFNHFSCNLCSGMYIVRLYNKGALTATQKLVIVR